MAADLGCQQQVRPVPVLSDARKKLFAAIETSAHFSPQEFYQRHTKSDVSAEFHDGTCAHQTFDEPPG